MNFNLTGTSDLTFNGNGGSASAFLGAMTIKGGHDITIANGVDVYVDSFTQTGGTGIDNFGETLHIRDTFSTQAQEILGEIIGGDTTFDAPIINAVVDITSLTIIDATSVTLTGTVGGDIIFIPSGPFGTFNGIGMSASTITVLNNPGSVTDRSTLQISEPIATSLAAPGASLGVGGINPAAGPACDDPTQPCPEAISGVYTYANAFIQGQRP
jgi:hypothetical protein